jgi:heat shock protein HslJ
MGGARGSGQAGAVRRSALLLPLAAAALLLASCAETNSGGGQPQPSGPPSASAGSLAGTHWTLVHFQSSAGVVVPPNVERYTLHFGADGALSLQLDCNRGMAHWTATPTSAQGGALTITQGAMSRAMCIAPGAIDTKLAGDLARVKSYTLSDGKLSLVLEGDAGVYLWAPAEAR